MTIDERWQDVMIYYTRLVTTKDEEYSRTLVVDATYSKADVEKLVLKTLPSVKQVKDIYEIEEAWLPKE